MIQYALTCENEHHFDSWFQSGDAFEKLHTAAMVTCAICGSSNIRKSVMAPRIGKSIASPKLTAEPERPLSAPATTAEQAFKELREKVEANSEDVGKNFATEARKMHHGETPERAIYGEAKPQEAKELIEEGVPVLPLPFMPSRKTN